MHALELDLPRHLYTETRDADGNITDLTYAADKLLSWSEYGGGSAIEQWCRGKYDREIEAIDNWEDNRFLALEERWLEQENGVDDTEAETRYEQACQTIAAAAQARREAAMQHLLEHRLAIEKLVEQSRAHIASQQPAEPVDYTFEILFSICGAAALIYMLLA